MYKLKNGSEYSEELFGIVWSVIKNLFENEPIVFYELVMKCRDFSHPYFGNTAEKLESIGLLSPFRAPHPLVKDIILSAVTGDGLEMTLAFPLAEVPEPSNELPTDHSKNRLTETKSSFFNRSINSQGNSEERSAYEFS